MLSMDQAGHGFVHHGVPSQQLRAGGAGEQQVGPDPPDWQPHDNVALAVVWPRPEAAAQLPDKNTNTSIIDKYLTRVLNQHKTLVASQFLNQVKSLI